MNDRGYGSVLALALLLGGVLLVGVAIDVARVVVAWREASFVAHTSAETGAGWVTGIFLQLRTKRKGPPRAVVKGW